MRMGYKDCSILLQCIVSGCGALLQCVVTDTSNTATHCNSTLVHGDSSALLQCVGTRTSNTATHCNSTLVLRPRCSVIMSPITYVNGTRKLQRVVAVCKCGNIAQFCCGSVTSAVWCCSVVLQCGAAVWCCSVVLQCGAAVWCCSVGLQCGAAVWCCSVVLQCGAAVWCCSVVLPRAKKSHFARCSKTLQPCTVWCCSVVLRCGAAVWCCSVVLQCGAAVWCYRVRRHHDTLKTQQTFAVAVLQCCCSVV